MSALAEALDWDDSLEIAKKPKAQKKGSVKRMVREARPIGSMSTSQIIGFLVRRHWKFLGFFALSNGLWIYGVIELWLHIRY